MPKQSIWISSLATVAVIVGVAHWVRRDETATPAPISHVQSEQDHNTVADEWQWQRFSKTKSVPNASEQVPANAVPIYRILQSVRLDANGRVVPDQTMKEALEQGFEDLGPNLSTEGMSQLQSLIRTGLAGPAGEEAAQILEDYYRFRLAEMEFEGQTTNSSAADRYEQLVQLRRSYLGAETADTLFEVEDTNGRHMLAAFAIQTNAELTDQEKQAQQQALQEKLNDRLLALGLLAPEEAAAEKVQHLRQQGASNADIYAARTSLLSEESARDLAAADREEAAWQQRFNGFWQARRYVMQAGLDEVERERQVEQLFEQYFSAEERERARVTSSDWQARDAK